jgi:hypothetical protein
LAGEWNAVAREGVVAEAVRELGAIAVFAAFMALTVAATVLAVRAAVVGAAPFLRDTGIVAALFS